MKMKVSLLAIAAAVALVSCEKDNNEPSPITKEQLLVTSEWKITDITRKSLTNILQDSSILKSCHTDDRFLFASSKGFQFKDNTAKCDSLILQYDAGTWKFNNTQDVLEITGQKKVQIWKVLTLNDSIMKVQWMDSVSASNKVLKTLSFKNR